MKKICLLASLFLTMSTNILADSHLFERTATAIVADYVNVDPKNITISEINSTDDQSTLHIEFFSPVIFSGFSFYQLFKCTLDAQTGEILSSNLGANGYATELEVPITPIQIETSNKSHSYWESLFDLNEALEPCLEGLEWDDFINSTLADFYELEIDFKQLVYSHGIEDLIYHLDIKDWHEFISILEDEIDIVLDNATSSLYSDYNITQPELIETFEFELTAITNEWLDNWKSEWGPKLGVEFKMSYDNTDINWYNISDNLDQGLEEFSEEWQAGWENTLDIWQDISDNWKSFWDSLDF